MERVLLAAALACLSGAAFAQAWPQKPVRIVIPIVAGGTTELMLRLISPSMAEALGQQVLLENRPGGSGIPASESVARSAPDGYTVAFMTSSHTISVPLLNKSVTYDPFRDFSPIGPVLEPVTLLLAGAASPAKSLRQMIDYAKQNPGKLSYGSSGVGSSFQLRGEAIKIAGGIDILHVPYKGTTQAMQDAVGGRIDLSFGTPASTKPLRESGKLVAIAVSNPSRFAALPDVPSLNELLPSYENIPSLFALWGPPGLPQPIVRRLNGETLKAMETAKMRAWLEENGLVVEGRTPEDLARLHKKGFDTFRKIIAAVGIKPE